MLFWLGMFAAGAVAAQSPMVTPQMMPEGMENQEGDIVTFEVVRGPENIGQTLSVNVRVAESGNMLQASDKGRHTLHFEPWRDLAYIDLDTIDDSVNEGESRLTFSILGGSGYSIGSPRSVSTTVSDNDVSEISVRGTTSSVRAGQNANLQISRNGTTGGRISVQIAVADTNNVLQAGVPATNTVELRSGQRSANVSLATRSDIKMNGSVHVTVMPNGNEYTPSISAGEATVNVTRRELELPTVSFERSTDRITEGQRAPFVVRRNVAEAAAVPVTIAVSTSRSSLVGEDFTPTRTVTIPAHNTTAVLEIRTVDDEMVNDDGQIRATIQPSNRFRTGNRRTKVVTVQESQPAEVSLTVVTGYLNRLREGIHLQFRVSRVGNGSGPITIPISVSESGDMLHAQARQINAVTISANRRSATFGVRTVNDDIDERDSTVRLTIGGTQPYGQEVAVIGESAIELTVQDDDPDTVTIHIPEEGSTTMVEGQSTIFELRREGVVQEMRAVTATVLIEHTGSRFNTTGRTMEVPLPATTAVVHFTVTVPDDDIDQDTASIRARILPRPE